MPKNIQNMLIAIFFAVSITFTASLITSTLNYTEFYTALNKLTINLVSVVPNLEGNENSVTLNLAIINNSSYNGLKVKRLWYILKFQVENEYNYLVGEEINFGEPELILPYSNITIKKSSMLSMGRETSKRFIELHNQNPQSIKWMIQCDVLTATFLGDVLLRSLKAYL